MPFIQRIMVNLEPGSPAWSIGEVLLLWTLVFAANFLIAHTEFIHAFMRVLRYRYFLLVQEPALYFHLYSFMATFALKISAVLFIWIILSIRRVPFMEGLALNRPVKKEWLWLFPAVALFSLTCRLISDVDPLSPNLPVYLFFESASATGIITALFSIVILAPVAEEIFFRGFVFPGLNKRLGLYGSSLATAALFAAVHIPQNRENLSVIWVIFAGGLIFSFVRAVTRSTTMAILLHALYNGTILLAGFIRYWICKY
ncbi:MAG: type II CAAX endopeptidase family protein [Candidatus Omnitrophota bacterium]